VAERTEGASERMMVSVEEDDDGSRPTAATAPELPPPAATGAASAGAGEAGRGALRRWRWYVAGAVALGAVALVVAGVAEGLKVRDRAGGAPGVAEAGATVPLSHVLSPAASTKTSSSSSQWQPPPLSSMGTKQQAAVGAAAAGPTRAPTIVPASSSRSSGSSSSSSSGSSSNSTTGGGTAAPETLLELLVALQQAEADKKYITSDYFGNEIPKENRPGQFQHFTGAPTATVIDDGAPVCHVENSIELRQAIEVRDGHPSIDP
jgi:hypothetical protein